MSKICKHYFISGKVQGVFFRAKTQNIAKKLNITGWVKNLSDGRVEIIACGEAKQLEKLQTAFYEIAQISNVVQEKLPYQSHKTFIIVF